MFRPGSPAKSPARRAAACGGSARVPAGLGPRTLDEGHGLSKPRAFRRVAPLLLVALLPCGACRSVVEGRDLDLSIGAQGLPGVGLGLAFSQRLVDWRGARIDLEAGLDRQELADESEDGNDFSRIWAGARWRDAEPVDSWELRLGVNWLRTEGAAGTLDDPGDYGGAYFGGGYRWEVGEALATGPDCTLMLVDSEGTRSGSGALLELAWRLEWHL